MLPVARHSGAGRAATTIGKPQRSSAFDLLDLKDTAQYGLIAITARASPGENAARLRPKHGAPVGRIVQTNARNLRNC
jgi:hypothetical protein